jgi:hypothetical protein
MAFLFLMFKFYICIIIDTKADEYDSNVIPG